MSITGAPDGEPMKVGVAVADLLTGLYATVAILAALNERHTSGLGQHIDLALLDVQIATLANQGMNYLASGKAPHGAATPIRTSFRIRRSRPAMAMLSLPLATTPNSRVLQPLSASPSSWPILAF